MPKKIIFIVSNYPGKFNPVAGLFYQRNVEHLVKLGYHVSVIAPASRIKQVINALINGSVKKLFQIEKKINSPQKGLDIYRPDYFPWPVQLSRKILVKLLKKSAFKTVKKEKIEFDIIDCRGGYPWCYIGTELASFYNKPLISTFIGSDINEKVFRSKYIKGEVGKIVKKSNALCAVSYDLKNTIRKQYGDVKVNVVYDGIEFEKMENQINPSLKNQYKSNNQIVLGFVGHLTASKGSDVILHLIKQLPVKYYWLIIGDGPYRSKFEAFSNVQLTGNLPPEKVIQCYTEMDAFIFPSRNEGIPNVVKEAAFAKLPVIASKTGGIPEAMANGKYGILVDDFLNYEAFFQAFNQLIDHWEHYQKVSNEHADFIKKNFDIKNTVRKLVKIYEGLSIDEQTNLKA